MSRHRPRRVCGAVVARRKDPCGGTFRPAVERLNGQGDWTPGLGPRMRFSPDKLECQQCGRVV